MCGRVSQFDSWAELVALMRLPGPDIARQQIEARYNIPPSRPLLLMHMEGDTLVGDLVRWGWRPHWATDNKLPSNARLEKVAHSAYWRAIWPHRAIAPVNGWFEWVDEGGPRKQPYYIRRRDKAACLSAAIGQFPTGDLEPREHDGCAIITDEAAGGLVDVHDRRPVVLSPDLASEWMDPATSTVRAEQMLLQQNEPPEVFEWFKVSAEANDARHDGSRLIEPIR